MAQRFTLDEVAEILNQAALPSSPDHYSAQDVMDIAAELGIPAERVRLVLAARATTPGPEAASIAQPQPVREPADVTHAVVRRSFWHCYTATLIPYLFVIWLEHVRQNHNQWLHLVICVAVPLIIGIMAGGKPQLPRVSATIAASVFSAIAFWAFFYGNVHGLLGQLFVFGYSLCVAFAVTSVTAEIARFVLEGRSRAHQWLRGQL
ncbi:MAG: hypothetical protein SFX74_10800 [Fimbriimonadaceae bacterium]|nr:hypothetical protein [Fimbriimonadaceae bacterium]